MTPVYTDAPLRHAAEVIGRRYGLAVTPAELITANPRPGDFGVVPIPGRGGELIRWAQWANGDGFYDYEHAFVVVSDTQVVEARPSGAGYDRLGRTGALYYTCPEDHRTAVAAAAVSLVGRPYSWLDYAALAAVRFRLPLSSAWLRHQVDASGGLICSQLVDLAYLMGGVHLFEDGRQPGDVTPGDLYALIAAQRGGR
jgi:uncharacterized protein YycO